MLVVRAPETVWRQAHGGGPLGNPVSRSLARRSCLRALAGAVIGVAAASVGWAQSALAAETASLAAPPPPAAAHVLNVRDFGAVGDGVTIDRAAIQKAVDSAHPGDAIYFPAGTYALDDSIKVLTSQLTLYGDGPTSVIDQGWHRGFDLGIFGEDLTGLVVQHLKFLGVPGKYFADNNDSAAIQIAGPQGTVINDCDFVGVGNVLNDVRNTYGTQISNCRVHGWGEVGIFCNGGEQVSNCQLVQDDPDLNGARSSHGFYIHSGAANIVIQDTLIQNVRKFAAQLYGEETGSLIQNIQFLRCTIKDCSEGLKIYQGAPDTAHSKNVLIEGCTFSGVYHGASIAVQGGEQIEIRNNTISDGNDAGLSLGLFNSWQWGMTMNGIRFENNTVQNCPAGIFALATSGGHLADMTFTGNTFTDCNTGITAISSFSGDFANVTISGNSFSNCKVELDLDSAGPGISVTP